MLSDLWGSERHTTRGLVPSFGYRALRKTSVPVQSEFSKWLVMALILRLWESSILREELHTNLKTPWSYHYLSSHLPTDSRSFSMFMWHEILLCSATIFLKELKDDDEDVLVNIACNALITGYLGRAMTCDKIIQTDAILPPLIRWITIQVPNSTPCGIARYPDSILYTSVIIRRTSHRHPCQTICGRCTLLVIEPPFIWSVYSTLPYDVIPKTSAPVLVPFSPRTAQY
jgi:hypothetical protein